MPPPCARLNASPASPAVLGRIVLLGAVSVGVKGSIAPGDELRMPPPKPASPPAELALIVLSRTVRDPKLAIPPPPALQQPVELPVTVLRLRVSAPSLRTPPPTSLPPPLFGLPPASVRRDTVTSAVGSTSRIRPVPAPVRRVGRRAPAMVTAVWTTRSASTGYVAARSRTRSCPRPARQPSTAVSVSAAA